MKVLLTNLQKEFYVDEAKLKRMAGKILRHQGRNDAELSIVLVDDQRIRLLNKKFRKINRSTDVLAFSMLEGDDSEINPALLGDIVISVETAQRCVRGFKLAAEEEIYHYLTHGILHLLGYDHRRKPERNAMREREEEIQGISKTQTKI